MSSEISENTPESARTPLRSTPAVHRHAFWFYGVIIALSAEEAMTSVVPHILDPPSLWPVLAESFRLIVFLTVCLRLLLGAGVHFEQQDGDGRAVVHPTYRVDFVSGFFHFLIVFAWSFTLDAPGREFLFWLGVVLAFDVVWLWFCGEKAPTHVRLWTAINVATLVLAVAVYAVATPFIGHGFAEGATLLVVFAASVIDIAEMIDNRPIFGAWLYSLVPEKLRGKM